MALAQVCYVAEKACLETVCVCGVGGGTVSLCDSLEWLFVFGWTSRQLFYRHSLMPLYSAPISV